MTQLFRLLLVVLCAQLFVAGLARAQDETVGDPAAVAEESAPAHPAPAAAAAPSAPVSPTLSEDWLAVAKRAETIVAKGSASSFALQRVRSDLAMWRDRFVALQSTNKSRISTVRAQIAALGPVPADSATENAAITARRSALDDQLALLRAPGLLAEEANARATGLISEIDALIRIATAESLTVRGAIPLNPANWPPAVSALVGGLRAMAAETSAAFSARLADGTVRRNIPAAFGILAVVALLVWQSRKWLRLARNKISARGTRGANAAQFIISLGQILFPLLGIIVLLVALRDSGLLGFRGLQISDGVLEASINVLVARWLAEQLFPFAAGALGPLDMPDQERTRARRTVNWLGWTLALAAVVVALISTGENNTRVSHVLLFPIEVVMSVLLFRMGRILARHGKQTTTYQGRLLNIFGNLAMLVAIVSVAFAAIGYNAAVTSLLFPAVTTLALFGILVLMQRLVIDLYGALTRRSENAQELLVPALLGLALLLLSLPLLALIWGARVETLTELWAQFREGFSLGETRISPTDFLTFALIFTVGYMLTRLVQSTLRGTILPKTNLDIGGQNAIVSGLGYLGIFLATVIAITSAGIDLSSLAIVAGALSVGIGFGLQNIVSNFVSGIILLIERPISEGDWIEVGGKMGYVRDISVRSTRIETFDRTDVIVPNADLVSGTVTNYTRGNTVGRVIVSVGVGYQSDLDRVATILREITEAQPMVIVQPPPSIYFVGIGADSFNFEIRAILRDINWVMAVKSDIYTAIAKRFAEENIEMPYQQRDLWLRNPETLHTGAKE